MAEVCSVMVERYAPHVAMVAIQFGYAGMNIITSAALAYGMNQFVYVCYRHAVATFFITPFAFFIERRVRPTMTFSIFCRIFLLALCGITMNQNLYAAGLHYTSPTFTSAMNNLVPAITFLIAVIFRLESVNIKTMHGQAKVIGTIVCVGGAMIMTLYKGHSITRIFSQGLNLGISSLYVRSLTDNGSLPDWKFGPMYLIASVILWSAWINLQAATLKRYPAQLSLTATMCFLATAQSGIVAWYFDRDPSVWTLKWNIELLSITYAGIINSGITYFVAAWCIKRRGPVFMAMFNPLVTVIVAIMGSIILHEILHVGSVVGAVLVILGLYIVVWGKAEDNQKLHRLSTTNATNGSVKSSNNIKTVDCNIDIEQPLLTT